MSSSLRLNKTMEMKACKDERSRELGARSRIFYLCIPVRRPDAPNRIKYSVTTPGFLEREVVKALIVIILCDALTSEMNSLA